MTVIINWYKGKDVADNGTYLSHSLIELRSQIHGEVLSQYEIYERLPKFLRKKANYREVFRGPLPAATLPPVEGRYHSQSKWKLPRPEKPDGMRRFVARAAGAISPEVQSAAMLIGSRKEERTTETDLDVEVRARGFGLRLPSLFRRKTFRKLEWVIAPAVDPRVEVKILQGYEVGQHLTNLEAAWAAEKSLELSPGTSVTRGIADYFEQRLVGDATLTCEIGPSTPLLVTAEIGAADDLRGVLCLQVHDLEADTKTISDPQFVTSVADRIIVSDLLPSMLGEQALSLLQALRAAQVNQQELADRSGLDAALDELGTSNLDDAVMLLSALSG